MESPLNYPVRLGHQARPLWNVHQRSSCARWDDRPAEALCRQGLCSRKAAPDPRLQPHLLPYPANRLQCVLVPLRWRGMELTMFKRSQRHGRH